MVHIQILLFSINPLGNNPNKEAYDLNYSKDISLEFIRKNYQALSCFIGYLGEIRQDHILSKHCIDTNAQFLMAAGPIVEATSEKIVVDMTAKECDFYTEEAKSLIPTILLNKGVFPFYGCSGCGLWVFDDISVKLIGIMSCKADEDLLVHRVEFVPIWKIIAAISSVASN